MTRDGDARDTRTSAADVAQGLLALLPALVLAWPSGGPVEHDFAPRSTGFGLAALLALPGIALFLVRRAAPTVRGSWLLLAPVLATAAWLAFGDPVDPFEATRATVGWALVLATLLLGAASDPATLARGAAFVGLLAAFSGYAAPHAGALGNSGATSEAATLGAAAGALLVLRDRGAWRVLGAAAFAAFVVHAARAPVLAGGVALAVALVFTALARLGRQRVAASVLAAAATLAVLVPFVSQGASADREPGRTDARETSAVDTSPASGVGVRAAILASSARMLAAHPLAGVGPGQFPAEFPPYRDAREIEASSHGRLQAAETEVEHAHDDWIQPALELGLVAGLLWVAFLATIAWGAWRALRSDDAHRAALGAGLLALLVHALARAPISSNAASATLCAAAAGALLVRRDAGSPAFARRFVAIASVLWIVLLAPRAWSLVRHGFALHPLADERVDDPERRERAIRKAADCAPDSVLVRSLEARLAEAHGEPPGQIAARWESVLALRPHRVEALVQFATASARSGDLAGARAALRDALELDPGNPPALQNLATIECQAGELAEGLAHLDRIPAARAPDAEWLQGLAARLALRGLDVESAALTARGDPTRTGLTPEERYARARELRAAGRDELADGWEARAHRAWADQHAAAARWNEAVRSLRQDLRLCLERPGTDPVRVRLALAAALHAAGRTEEARQQLASSPSSPTARDRSSLPAWTREPLAALDRP
ncbi:MAG: O-antigen ligase family protein [Planctomycetota bacterium]|nr:O-antigen ligase family protein [Planctomycetota bacterium]